MSVMRLPQGADYLRCVQNPSYAFSDAELKSSKPELTPLGLPKPYSGGFTTTFKLIGAQNRAWAVRCFTRSLENLWSRYQAITSFILQSGNTYFVETLYLPQGILVNGTWYPIIKMAWVTGDPLNRYVEKRIANSNELQRIANVFRQMIADLAKCGVAHGDLQHGNILVHNGSLRLIDYDGMYLPSIAQYGGNNNGHPNYQHPGRNASDFSPGLDHFSAIVIYTALLALSQRPSLWRSYNNDENILFRQSDFLDPDNSPLIQDLCGLDPPIPEYARRIAGLCRCNFADVPSLENFLAGFQPTVFVPAEVYRARSPYPVLSADDTQSILRQVGQRVEIVGKVVHWYQGLTKYGKPYMFLNLTQPYPMQTFTIVLWSEALENFLGSDNDPLQYLDQWVAVTGVVEAYNGKPQIAVEVPAQVTMFKNETEARKRLEATRQTMEQQGTREPTSILGPATKTDRSLDSKEIEVSNMLYGKKSEPSRQMSIKTEPVPSSSNAVPSVAQNPPVQKHSGRADLLERIRRFLRGI